MDFVKNMAGSGSSENKQPTEGSNQSGGGGGFMDKINGMAGGGQASEKNEDYLDKAIDMGQERFMGAGDQSNESAVEQAKDEQISDYIRGQYKSMSGSDMPIKDKPTSLDKSTD